MVQQNGFCPIGKMPGELDISSVFVKHPFTRYDAADLHSPDNLWGNGKSNSPYPTIGIMKRIIAEKLQAFCRPGIIYNTGEFFAIVTLQ